ncbi:MAG: PQQ-dependent sugar dehydrogenase [Pseudobdellovibrionaceae bacterium]
MKFIALIFIVFFASVSFASDLPLDKLKLPVGFKISLWARVEGARSMSLAPDGRLFVGTRDDKVYVVENGQPQILVSGLNMPNGVAYRNGKLYVAEVNRILEFDVSKKQQLPVKPSRELNQAFPSDTHHGWKFVRFGPDGKLYVPVGANCNICDPKKDYARIYRIDVNGTSKKEVASGVRFSVGFDFDPHTNELWFTDNGRDWMGDDVPPDELNHLTKVAQNFGFPYCHGKNILDPKFGKGKSCHDFVPPVVELPAHVAALGMRFYTGDMFPAIYKNGIILAEHGSWNRSVPQGYRLTFVQLRDSQPVKVENFVEGWLQGASAWGRPVDVELMKDGSILVSDDKAGAIYHITYVGQGSKE